MSGIAGIFFRDNRLMYPDLIKKMNKSIAHRGPDGSEEWADGSVALAHQMLHTTPESLHEKLPYEGEDLVITADARIDNRKELSEELKIEDIEGISDSYFILKAYQKWGEKCPEKLLGDFAFAIWDKKESKLFCARDHMGVKPFYYYLSDKLFTFASEIKALLTVPEVPYQINEEQVFNYLAIFYDDRCITSYKDVFRLPAAYCLTVSFNDSKLHRYWELDGDYELTFDSDEEYAKTFLEIFSEAVRCRLRSAFPVGSMLSGGLDSSSVACIAQKILNKHGKYSLKTFSAYFETVPESDEQYYINKVVEHDNLDSYFIEADKLSPLLDAASYLSMRDEPMILPNSFMIWEIYKEACKNDVRVVLDGLDGDTTVSYGRGFLTELALTLSWNKLFFEINGRSKRVNTNPFRIMISVILDALIPKVVKRIKLFLLEYFRGVGSGSRIINPNSDQRGRLIKSSIDFQYKRLVKTNSKKRHYYGLNSAIPQHMMESMDWLSSTFSIEARHPFFDKRLVEFCLAIPTEQKLWNGWDRSIMRKAMNNIIPPNIQWRKKKTDLSPNFYRNLIKFEQDLLDDIILRNTYLIEDFVDIPKLQMIYKQYKSGDTKDVIHIWDALILALWRRNKSIN